MTFLPSVTKKFWVAIVAVSILAIVFTFYFRVYIPAKEVSFTKKKFLAINRAGKNMVEEYSSYKKIADNKGLAIRTKVEREFLKTNFHSVSRDVNEIIRTMAVRVQAPFESNWMPKFNIIDKPELADDTIYFSTSLAQTVYEKLHIPNGHFAISVRKFIDQELPKEDFDKFMLIRITKVNADPEKEDTKSEDCCCCKLKKQSKSDRSIRIAYQNFDGEISVDNIDSLVSRQHGLIVEQAVDVSIQNSSYQFYSTRFHVSENEEWLFGGFVSTAKFRDDTRSIEPADSLMLTIMLLLTILAMPLLKLALMSPIERLQIFNVWSTGFSIVAGTAIICVSLLGLWLFFQMRERTDHNLRSLAEAVSDNFRKEVNDVCSQIDNMKGFSVTGEKRHQFGSILADTVWDKGSPQEKIVERLTKYREFNELLWLNRRGENLLSVTSYDVDPDMRPPSLGGRTYFKQAIAKDGWSFTPGVPHTKFALQSMSSYSSDEAEAGVGRFSDDIDSTGVVAIATKLHSVMEPLLPPGYSFAIIDEHGLVWFHSNSNYNMQQNLVNESGGNGDLVSALSGRNAMRTTFRYENTLRRAYLAPIKNIPLFVVCCYNTDYLKTPLIQTLILVWLLLVFLFIISGIHLLLLYIAGFNKSKLKVRRFFLNWLTPSYDAVSLEKYIRGIACFFVFGLLSLALFATTKENDRATLAFFLTLPVYTLFFAYILFNAAGVPPRRVTRDSMRKTKLFIIFSACLDVALNIFMCQYVEKIPNFIFLQLILLVTMWLSLQGLNLRLLSLRWIERWREVLYNTFMSMWLIVTVVIPLFFFFWTAYYHEHVIWSRYVQLQAARSEIKRDEALLKRDFEVPMRDRVSAAERGNYMTSTGDLHIPDGKTNYRLERRPLRIDTLVFRVIPLFDDTLFRQSRAQVFRSATDSLWTWGLSEDQHDLSIEYKTQNNAIQYASFVYPFYFLHKNVYSFTFWTVFITFMLVVIFVIRFSSRNIFGLGLIPEANPSPPLHFSKFLQTEWATSKTIIVGLPYSGKHALLSQFKNSVVGKVSCLSFKDDLTGYNLQQDSDKVIIENFEARVNDHKANKEKLDILQGLSTRHKTQVLISSSIQPSMIIDYYERMIELTNSRPEDRQINSEYRAAMNNWKMVLSDYTIVYQPLNHSARSLERLRYVDRELVHGNFLLGLRDRIGRVTRYRFKCEEDFYLAVEEHAEVYYASIWNSLSKMEKFLMYDLARDMFVNIKDPKLISILRQKGVIVLEDTPRVVNESFNNFILSTVSADEEMTMDKELRQKGTWSIVQLVIIIVLLGIGVFVGMAQPNLLRDLSSVLTAVGAVTAFLLRFGGLFGSDVKVKT